MKARPFAMTQYIWVQVKNPVGQKPHGQKPYGQKPGWSKARLVKSPMVKSPVGQKPGWSKAPTNKHLNFKTRCHIKRTVHVPLVGTCQMCKGRLRGKDKYPAGRFRTTIMDEKILLIYTACCGPLTSYLEIR